MSVTKIRFPLRYKLILFGGLLSVVPAILIGFGLMEVNATTLETQNREMRLAVAREMITYLDSTFSEIERTLITSQQILTNPDLGPEERIAIVSAMVEAERRTTTIAIYDKQGNYNSQIHQSGERIPEKPIDESIRKQVAMKSVVISGPYPADNPTWVAMTLGLRPDASDPFFVAGYLTARVPLEDAQREVLKIGDARLDAESRLDIVATDGTVLLSTHASEVGSHFEGKGILADLPTLVEQGVAHSGEVIGTKILVSALPMNSVPWVAKVEVPLTVAYASLYKMRWIVAVGTMIAAILALVIAIVVANRLSNPLLAVTAFTRRLGARIFTERVEVHTDDEIEVVADALNHAAEELQASEERIKKEIEIRNDLGRYLPSELVDNIVKREASIELGGERREISVLFADIVRFTPLCEEHPPERVVALLNELFTLVTTIIFETGGTVDKFIGDCVMAFWGAPSPDEDHAVHALMAAEKINRLLEVGNRRWEDTFGIKIQIAIGVNSGEAVIGNIGSEKRIEYTAIGNTVNEAARLEGLARPGQILVTAGVVKAAGDLFDYASVSEELLSLGGIRQEVFEVLTQ